MKSYHDLRATANNFIVTSMKLNKSRIARKVGRPLSFDRERALHQAMLLFWQHGYEATSLSDLTAAMGVTPPSIYTAFGDKRSLFLEAVRHYLSGPVTSETIIQNAATAREAAASLIARMPAGEGPKKVRELLMAQGIAKFADANPQQAIALAAQMNAA